MSNTVARSKPTDTITIGQFIREQNSKCATICRSLKKEIDLILPKLESRIYHGSPVWFIGENAIVGISVTKSNTVRLLFWNGQSLKEPELIPVGKFNAAHVIYQDKTELNQKSIHRWLRKAEKNIWDLAKLRKSKL